MLGIFACLEEELEESTVEGQPWVGDNQLGLHPEHHMEQQEHRMEQHHTKLERHTELEDHYK
jgi:hypothetical protein